MLVQECLFPANRGLAFIVLVGVFQLSKRYGLGVATAAYRAYQDGKNAAWLPAQDWEFLLTQPIGNVRAQLNIRPPQRYQHLRRLDALTSI